MEVGFRRCFEEQRYKCSLCGEAIRPKRISKFNIITIILLLAIGIFSILNPVSSLAVSGTVDLDHEIGQIRGDFYGVVTGVNALTSTATNNWTFQREKLLEDINNLRMNIREELKGISNDIYNVFLGLDTYFESVSNGLKIEDKKDD